MTLWAIQDKRLHEGAGVIMVNRSLDVVRAIPYFDWLISDDSWIAAAAPLLTVEEIPNQAVGQLTRTV